MMQQEKNFYDEVGKNIGWDFSIIESRKIIKGKKWDFLRVVKQFLNKDKILLYIGTGGGEKILQISYFCKKIVGIDNSLEMVNKSNENLVKSGRKNIEFRVADSKKLPFNDNFFDIVTARHAPFSSKEVTRVLKKGGLFISQQVGESDKKNIKKLFGRGQSFGKKSGNLIRRYIQELKDVGFKIIRKNHYDAIEYYKDIKDITFLLEHTPIIPKFNHHKDQKILKKLEKKYKTNKGIKTNSERFLIVPQKL